MEKIRPVGVLKISTQGKSHIPEVIRKEVGLQIGVSGEIPYFLVANCVLLARRETSLKDMLTALDVLKEDLKLRVARA